jgi:alanine racemase
MRATRAIIHLEHLQANIAEIRKKLAPGTKLCIPVKADGYGHGALKVAVAAIRAGCSYLAVASVQEGIDLREAGIVAPIISLSLPIPEEIPSIIEYSLTPLVVDSEFIAELGKTARLMGRTAPVHLKIDTGMGRIGCSVEEAPLLAREIAKEKNLFLEGTATHLSVADSLAEDDIAFTRAQIQAFNEALASMRAEGIDPGIVHAANSGGVLLYPESHFDMVRPGILVYGYPPAPELADRIRVLPVMELKTQIVSIKKISAGAAVSYGRTWTTAEDTFIATIPVGYADGLVRRLSPGLSVRIGEEDFPVVGKICMDQCMIDIGADPWVQRWDHVTIFGPPPAPASAETLASCIGTIPYEITCGINKRVPRVYLGDEARNL